MMDRNMLSQRITVTMVIVLTVIAILAVIGWLQGNWTDAPQPNEPPGASQP